MHLKQNSNQVKRRWFSQKVLSVFLIFFGIALITKAQDFTDQKLYRISSPSGLYLDNKESEEDNDKLFLSSKSDSEGQLWKITKQKNGTYTIENPFVKKSLDSGNINSGFGNEVIQWEANPNNSNQQWEVVVTGMGTYIFTQKNSKMNLALNGEDVAGATVYQKPNSPLAWTITETAIDTPEDVIERGAEWENELIFAINKEEGHNTYVVYPSLASLKADKYYDTPWIQPTSPYYQSLDGQWKFNWVKQPSDRPMDFYKEDFNATAWKEIKVPSCWESLGYGSMMYTNITYPFKKTPPMIKVVKGYTIEEEPNPVGSYIKEFNIPQDWDGKEIFLHFNGVYSGMYVWVNGQKVGYSEGANNDAEFDITKYVHKGDNKLAVEVYKWTDGSFIEDQDMFRFAGIHRSVYLYATPQLHVRDYFIQSTFNNDALTDATLKVDAAIKNYATKKSNAALLDISLLDTKGNLVTIISAPIAQLKEGEEKKYDLQANVQNPLLWSAETPHLYTVTVSLKDKKGVELEAMSSKFGFRKIEVKNKRVYVNNQPIFFKGVNRHDSHPEFGKTVPVDMMITDILLMKNHNINTLRTSHYPNNPEMYALLDYYGLYVMDEADLENHGNGSISDMPTWTGAYVDRAERVIQRDKNHPSVIFWSLGNESGNGNNFWAVRERVKELDASRPIHYEGKNEVADIDSHMYPSLDRMIGFDQQESDKPYFLCEYVHSMGNAMGNMAEYWDYIENNSQRMIGGCIWDWVDQAHVKIGEPKDRFYYGGDWGERPTSGDFSGNGITTPDRRVTAKLIEVKRIYQYIKFEPVALDAGKIRIKNKYNFLNLDNFVFTWKILKDGVEVESGTLPTIDLDPNGDVIVKIPFKRNFEGGKEYFLNLSASLKETTSWADKGHEVASAQFALTPRATVPMVDKSVMPTLQVKTVGNKLDISASNFSTTFDTALGRMISLKYNGTEFIYNQQGLDLNWYRSVSNDKFTDQNYYTSTPDKPLVTSTVAPDKKSVTIITDHLVTVNSGTPIQIPYQVRYTIYGDGTIDVDASFTKYSNASIVRRLGLQMQLPQGFESIKYYGKGPHENYSDRIISAYLGEYSTSPKDMEAEHYIRAQSLGNREDIRFVEIVNDKGDGLKVTSKDQLSFSALHFTDKAVWEATHDFNLDKIRQPQVYFNLDAVQQGLGNATCGPNPLHQYMIPENQPINYSFRIQAVK